MSGDLLPHGDETLFVGISKFADVYRTLTRTQMLQPPDAKQFADMEQVRRDYDLSPRPTFTYHHLTHMYVSRDSLNYNE